MGYKGVQPTSTWGILRLQPTDPNLLPALPRGHHYANQLQGVQKVGAWPWQVDLGRLLCSEVKPPGKPSRVSWGNTCVFQKKVFQDPIWIIVIVGGWRIFQCSTTILRHQCSALMFGTWAWKVIWNQMASLRMMIHPKGAWWFWDAPPQKQNTTRWWLSNGRNPEWHLVAVFGVIETVCFEDVFFSQKKCGVLLVVILGEGPLIFSDRNIGWKE